MMLLFWENVDKRLKSLNLTHKDFAEAMEISYRTLQGWINKDRYPDVIQAYMMANCLECSVEFLINGTSNTVNLAPAENQLVEKFRKLDKNQQESILNIIQAIN